MSVELTIQLKELALTLQRGTRRSLVNGAITEIERLREDRDRWKDLAIRGYKEMFTIDQDRSDHKVWIEMEDAYENLINGE